MVLKNNQTKNGFNMPIIVLISAVIASFAVWFSQNLKRNYKNAVRSELVRTQNINPALLTEQDINHLPDIVKKYIRFTGFIGKPKAINFRTEFSGGIRSNSNEEFMTLRSVQYNFLDDNLSRLFYITAKKAGIPAIGLHLYQNAQATFTIKILGLFQVVNAFGQKMNQGESVTVLNDMCVMAPGSLIDRRITWETIDSTTVKAIFTNKGITVSALLYFTNDGKLVNFISNDRYETDGKVYNNYPWETPVLEYRNFNDYQLPSKAKLIYKRKDGDFCYGEFDLVSVEYNCRILK
jgi:hypothetical protein